MAHGSPREDGVACLNTHTGRQGGDTRWSGCEGFPLCGENIWREQGAHKTGLWGSGRLKGVKEAPEN